MAGERKQLAFESQQPEKKEVVQTTTSSYPVVYYFPSSKNVNFGHISMALSPDCYVGYGGSQIFSLDDEKSTYHDCKVIEIPLPNAKMEEIKKLAKNWECREDSKNHEWNKAKYDMGRNNCAHAVLSHLGELYPEQLSLFSARFVTPKEVASFAVRASRSVLSKEIELLKTQLVTGENAYFLIESIIEKKIKELQLTEIRFRIKNTFVTNLTAAFNEEEKRDKERAKHAPEDIKKLTDILQAIRKNPALTMAYMRIHWSKSLSSFLLPIIKLLSVIPDEKNISERNHFLQKELTQGCEELILDLQKKCDVSEDDELSKIAIIKGLKNRLYSISKKTSLNQVEKNSLINQEKERFERVLSLIKLFDRLNSLWGSRKNSFQWNSYSEEIKNLFSSVDKYCSDIRGVLEQYSQEQIDVKELMRNILVQIDSVLSLNYSVIKGEKKLTDFLKSWNRLKGELEVISQQQQRTQQKYEPMIGYRDFSEHLAALQVRPELKGASLTRIFNDVPGHFSRSFMEFTRKKRETVLDEIQKIKFQVQVGEKSLFEKLSPEGESADSRNALRDADRSRKIYNLVEEFSGVILKRAVEDLLDEKGDLRKEVTTFCGDLLRDSSEGDPKIALIKGYLQQFKQPFSDYLQIKGLIVQNDSAQLFDNFFNHYVFSTDKISKKVSEIIKYGSQSLSQNDVIDKFRKQFSQEVYALEFQKSFELLGKKLVKAGIKRSAFYSCAHYIENIMLDLNLKKEFDGLIEGYPEKNIFDLIDNFKLLGQKAISFMEEKQVNAWIERYLDQSDKMCERIKDDMPPDDVFFTDKVKFIKIGLYKKINIMLHNSKNYANQGQLEIDLIKIITSAEASLGLIKRILIMERDYASRSNPTKSKKDILLALRNEINCLWGKFFPVEDESFRPFDDGGFSSAVKQVVQKAEKLLGNSTHLRPLMQNVIEYCGILSEENTQAISALKKVPAESKPAPGNAPYLKANREVCAASFIESKTVAKIKESLTKLNWEEETKEVAKNNDLPAIQKVVFVKQDAMNHMIVVTPSEIQSKGVEDEDTYIAMLAAYQVAVPGAKEILIETTEELKPQWQKVCADLRIKPTFVPLSDAKEPERKTQPETPASSTQVPVASPFPPGMRG